MEKVEEVKYSIECPRCHHVNIYPEGASFAECDGCNDKLMVLAPADPPFNIVAMTECDGAVYVATATRVYRLVGGMIPGREEFVPVRFTHE